MPPTVIQNSVDRSSSSRIRAGERRSDLVCRVKYCNTLPDIPFDPKFINYPFPPNRYVQYKPTSLEKNYKYEVLTEHDLGVSINLINPDVYASESSTPLLPADEKLLEDDILAPQAPKRSRHHHVNVSWLRRTEYISTETTRYQPQSMDKIEATVGFATRKKVKNDEPLYTDRESQIEAIEKTFCDVTRSVQRHYSKPGVTPVEELPVFPDFELWKYPCAQVIFDTDPAPVDFPVPMQIEQMSQAMIRGVVDESGDQFVAYFLPTEETLEKRKQDIENNVDYVDEEEYEYVMAREYNWNLKNKASKGYEENYFLVIREDGVYYDELETRLRLNRRRLKPDHQHSKSRLVVTHRPLNEEEHKAQVYREKMLEPPVEEDEVDEAMEEEDWEASGNESPQGSVENRSPVPSDNEQNKESNRESDEEQSDAHSDQESDQESDRESHQNSDEQSERASNVESDRDSGSESDKKSDDSGSD